MRELTSFFILLAISVQSIVVCASSPHSPGQGQVKGKDIGSEKFDCMSSAQAYLSAKGNGCQPANQQGQGDTKNLKKFTCKGSNAIKSAEIEKGGDPKNNTPARCTITIESKDEKTGKLLTYKRVLDKDGKCIEEETITVNTKGDNKGSEVQKVRCGKNDNLVTYDDYRDNARNSNNKSNCSQIHMLNGSKQDIDCKKIDQFLYNPDFVDYKKDPAPTGNGPSIKERRENTKPRNTEGGSSS